MKKVVNFGQWTFDGEYLSCEKASYHLSIFQLKSDLDWIEHMKPKRWCNQLEFKKGYEYACKFWGINPNK